MLQQRIQLCARVHRVYGPVRGARELAELGPRLQQQRQGSVSRKPLPDQPPSLGRRE